MSAAERCCLLCVAAAPTEGSSKLARRAKQDSVLQRRQFVQLATARSAAVGARPTAGGTEAKGLSKRRETSKPEQYHERRRSEVEQAAANNLTPAKRLAVSSEAETERRETSDHTKPA
jgi:hypothetical protein